LSQAIRINSKTGALVAAAISGLFCSNHSRLPVLYMPPESPEIRLEFAGMDLIRQTRTREETGPLPGTRISEVAITDDQCIRSHSPGFFEHEEGLRFEICGTGIDREQFETSMARRERASMGHLFELREISLTEIRKLNSEIVVDHAFDPLSVQSTLTLNTGGNLPAVYPLHAPRVFADIQHLSIVFARRDSRFMILETSDPRIVAPFLSGLSRVPGITNNLRGSADVYVSEVKQGKDAFLEISSRTAGRAKLRILRGASVENLELYFFGGSAYVFDHADAVELPSGVFSITADQYETAGGNATRSVTVRDEHLVPTACLQLCDSRGISSFPSGTSDDACKPEDLELTELSPAGVYTDHVDASGKFLEVRVKRSCMLGSVLLRAGSTIDPGQGKVESGARLLFASSSEFFSEKVLDADLRSLNYSTPVEAFDSEGHAAILYSPDADARWADSSGFVHSIVLDQGVAIYHDRSRVGLRPDLTSNAMSPGLPEISEAPHSSFSLSEVSLMGSWNGSSVPDDEFIELTGKEGGPGRWTVDVKRLSDGKTIRHHFPPQDGIAAYFRKSPVCFPGYFGRADLFLPNEPVELSWFDSHGENQGHASVSPALATSMSSAYASAVWHESTHSLRVHSPIVGICAKANASPGAPGSPSPFFAEEPSPAGRIFRFYSDVAASISVEIDGLSSSRMAANEDLISVTALRPRSVFRITASGAQVSGEVLLSPGLAVTGVHPSPVAPGVEWIRVCATAPFFPQTNLYVHDEDSEDRIVPFSQRTGRALLSSTMNLPAFGCALIVDPDYTGQSFPPPPFPFYDYAGWSISSTSAIGSGLGADESVWITNATGDILATYGLPDIAPFHVHASSGQTIVRTWPSYDAPESWSAQ
ncbi:MAG TPA: hypothetical protein PKJ30_03970, partial [Leptospiraceae bacterium]|nr:hypothetical protein [Leptospiraceae bacterium]